MAPGIVAVLLASGAALAAAADYREELVTTAQMASGETVPYILDVRGASPRYVLILFPGGTGRSIREW